MAKYESLGLLAGGIAHNLKNFLTNISLNIDFIRIKPESSEKYLSKITKAVEQATNLATRFQTFSKGGAPLIKTVSVMDFLDDSIAIGLSGSNLECHLKTDEDLWNVRADSKQMVEVMINIITNAKQAMPEGDHIDIKVSNTKLSEYNDFMIDGGDYVKIEVTDFGVGIERDNIDKLFDPFFTTKKTGSGLGLASSNHIVQNHKGVIDVESEPGKWTRFDVYIPASHKAIERKCGVANEDTDFIGKKILLMDDNEEIRIGFEEMTTLLGYEIDTAMDGPKTIQLYNDAFNSDRPYDAVILDLVIQGSKMQGLDVLKALKTINPDVCAIVFSGHSSEPVVANYQDYGFHARLEKPINIKSLRETLNRLFNQEQITNE